MALYTRQNVPIVVLSAVLVLGAIGCASSSKRTTTVETTTTTPAIDTYDAGTTTRVEKTATTHTTTEAKPQSTGIISGTVHVLGAIIAFPFKMIGKLFEAIF